MGQEVESGAENWEIWHTDYIMATKNRKGKIAGCHKFQ